MKKYVEYFNITKTNVIKKKKFFFLPLNRKSLMIANIMTKYNISVGYKKCIFNQNLKIKLYLNYETESDRMKNLCKPANMFYVKHFFLKKYHAKHLRSVYILSTSKGLIDSKNAEKNKLGGVLLFKLN